MVGKIMNAKIENWIRESAPTIHLNEVKKEAHLAVLKERFRQREVRRSQQRVGLRRLSFAGILVLFFMSGSEVSELGSEGFDVGFRDN